jgi:glycosyltransferase involved in cell wall biosynthesis
MDYFGLTVMESIEVGCPVISYDVRYGPSEIIEHGVNVLQYFPLQLIRNLHIY